MKYCLIIFVLLFSKISFADCKDWFVIQKLRAGGETCLGDCIVADVDMGTFSCRNQCDVLCRPKKVKVKKIKKPVIIKKPEKNNSSSLYPGLNEAEKKIISEYPLKAMGVGVQKFKAEYIANKLFSYGSIDGENDAARHFMWSALTAREIGSELATQFLDAHEKNPDQKPEQRAMDLANNREGLLAYEKLKNKGKTLDEDIINEFKERYDGNNLSILKPQKMDLK
jgi:hypothetical protein